MTRTELTFGRYAGWTISQVLFVDPGWFFWAHWNRALLRHGIYAGEELAQRATRIRPPRNRECDHVIEYAIDRRSGGLARVQCVPAETVREMGGSPSFTRPYIDLSVPSQLALYDKTGGRIIVAFLKAAYFGSTRHRMTRERCAEFFDDPSNFGQRPRC